MKTELKKVFFLAMLGGGFAFGAGGTYIAGNAAIKEYVTHKSYYDAGKSCVQRVKRGENCRTEDYRRAALYADNKKDYAFGLSWLFGGSSFIRMSLGSLRTMRKDKSNDILRKPRGYNINSV